MKTFTRGQICMLRFDRAFLGVYTPVTNVEIDVVPGTIVLILRPGSDNGNEARARVDGDVSMTNINFADCDSHPHQMSDVLINGTVCHTWSRYLEPV